MPISIVQTKNATISSATGSHVVTFNSQVTVGNWVVIAWRQGTNNRTPGVPVPSAGTWSGSQDFLASNGTSNSRIYQWSAQHTGAATDTYTITIAGSNTAVGVIQAWELSGVDTSGTPRGGSGTQNLASSSSWNLIASPGVTLASGDIIIGAAGEAAAGWGTLTAPSGFTTRFSSALSPATSTWMGDNLTAGSGITGAASTTIARAVYTGYQIYLQASSGTSISISDTGSGSDATPFISCSLSQSETGSGTDATSGISCSLSQADTGAGVDGSPSCSVDLSLAESGSAVDALGAVDVLLAAITDSGSGADVIAQIQQGILIALAESGLGTDSIANLACSLTQTDSGSGVDTLAIAVQLQQIIDACVGSDTVAAAVAVSVSESGSGSDSLTCSVQLALADSASGVDLLTSLAVLVAVAEAANAIDTLTVYTGSASSGRVATISFTPRAKSSTLAPETKSATFTPNL